MLAREDVEARKEAERLQAEREYQADTMAVVARSMGFQPTTHAEVLAKVGASMDAQDRSIARHDAMYQPGRSITEMQGDARRAQEDTLQERMARRTEDDARFQRLLVRHRTMRRPRVGMADVWASHRELIGVRKAQADVKTEREELRLARQRPSWKIPPEKPPVIRRAVDSPIVEVH
jgi:hypothetical protein